MGVKKLLPENWKAFAWIDADIEFDNPSWPIDTLKVLNGCRDVVQLFSHAIDMDQNKDPLNTFYSFGFQYSKNREYTPKWHPGFAWACTRKAYETMGGLYETSILGAGDHNMALSFINKGRLSISGKATDDYKDSVQEFENKIKNLRLGYIPVIICHHFHGSKKFRKYTERWQILINNQYSPTLHITKNSDGLLIPTDKCPKQLLKDIYTYFSERNEDEFLLI